MGFGERVVYFQCLQRRLLGFRKGLLRGYKMVRCKGAVAIGQAGISQGVSGILGDRLLKVFDALIQSLLGSLVPPVAAFQIILIGFGISGVGLGQALLLIAR